MFSVKDSEGVYVYTGVLDMRVSFDRLSEKVKKELDRSVVSGGYFVFFSRKREKVKILYWDRDGYCLWMKRLEAGVFRITTIDGYETVTGIDLELLLSGVDFSRIKFQKSIEKGLYS